MERFRSCPICTEELLKEVYQCLEGHIICSSCISRVTRGLCPQCRVPFGKKKIRNRALEELLDLEDFDCKFKESGCTASFKRGELENHAKICSFNPEVPLCKLITGKDDMFRFTSVSKDDIISHFKKEHTCFERRVSGDTWFVAESGGFLRSLIDKKVGAPSTPSEFLRLYTFSASKLSPLFLIYGQVDHVEEEFSVGCVKVHGSLFYEYANFTVEFQLTRDGNPISPSPLGGSVKVSSVAETRQTLKTATVTFSNEDLKRIDFGMKMGDSLAAKIVFSGHLVK